MSPSQTTKLFLCRHGATAANELRPYILQGSAVDNPLSPTGERQAAALAEEMQRHSLAAVYCSRMLRARQTAAAVAKPHRLGPQPIESIHEVDVGLWEGLSWDAIRDRHTAEFDAFVATPGTAPYLGGESYADVLLRIEPVFGVLLRRHVGQQIAVVAHNVVNRAYLAHLLGLDINLAKKIEQANTCINVVEYDASTGSTSLVTLNANFHVPASK